MKPSRERDAALLRRVMKSYDGKASSYDDIHGHEQRIKHSIALARLRDRLREATSCLDCGCGTGLLLEELKDLFRDSDGMLVGLDVSAGMLRMASNRRGCEAFQLIRGDSNNIPIKRGVFDLIFAFTILDGEVNGFDTLRELSRVSTSNGLIVASTLRSSLMASTFSEHIRESGLKILEAIDLKGLNEVILILGKGDGSTLRD
ncbi:MAG: class I SAM-dependent DNA methyltransferase [Candidatus Bathyarchaeia archaeon]